MEDRTVLFDMDGTLVSYEERLISDMSMLLAPDEIPFTDFSNSNDEPSYIKNRMRLIKSSSDWWASLGQFKLGFDIWKLMDEFGMRKMILTQGPKNNPAALAGKLQWIRTNLGPDVEFTMTRDKGLVYGKILVDDWPEYITRWLEWRPRGLVIMPASNHNVNFQHPQVIRYDGSNLEEVRERVNARMVDDLDSETDQ